MPSSRIHSLGLGAVTNRNSDQLKPRHAICQAASEGTSDRSQTRYGDACGWHQMRSKADVLQSFNGAGQLDRGGSRTQDLTVQIGGSNVG